MQADAIPDWAVYILFAPFFPIAGFIHFSLEILQVVLIIGAIVRRAAIVRSQDGQGFRFLQAVYLPFLVLPNIVVILWGIATDPAL